MVVTGGTNAGEFLRLLGNGHEYGVERLFYAYQDKPGGIAEALGSPSVSSAVTAAVSCSRTTSSSAPLRPVVDRFEAQPTAHAPC